MKCSSNMKSKIYTDNSVSCALLENYKIYQYLINSTNIKGAFQNPTAI